ncbi:hypothetical protein JW905_16650 [bacterium]|nr:hypothetical protein [candidate division CSSED10-310 bacterium]
MTRRNGVTARGLSGWLTALLMWATVASGATIHVPADQPDMNAALAVAVDGDVVMVADGTYQGPGNRDVDLLGKAVLVTSEHGSTECVIDCGYQGRAFLLHNGESYNTEIHGFTIRHGIVSGSGGAIHCCGASAYITDCCFEYNGALHGGALHCAAGAAPIVVECLFEANHATGDGGALLCDGAAPAVACSLFLANTAGARGGAVCVWDGAPLIGASSEAGNMFAQNRAGAGADLAAGPAAGSVIDATWNGFEGFVYSDYYVAPHRCFNLDNCASFLEPITQDVFVKVGGSDANSGLSWEEAFATVRHATSMVIGTVANPVTIHVGVGTFSPSLTNEWYPIPLMNHVTLAGAGSGSTSLHAEGCSRVLYGYNDHDTQVTGIDLLGGQADRGAGLYLEASGVLVDDVAIRENTASESGGGLYALASDVTAYDCRFEDNGSFSGGGLYIEGAHHRLNACFINGNSADLGGGIYADSALLDLETCLVDGNEARRGGGIWVTRGALWSRETELSGNVAWETGGGLHARSEVLNMIWCVVAGNRATNGGGLNIEDDPSSPAPAPLITHCRIQENAATVNGGGLRLSGAGLILSSSLMERNSAMAGGGIHLSALTTPCSPLLANDLFMDNRAALGGGFFLGTCPGSFDLGVSACTFTGNQASLGAALYLSDAADPAARRAVTASDCIFWGDDPDEIQAGAGIFSIQHSTVQGGYPGTAILDLDPLCISGPDGPAYLSQIAAGQTVESPAVDAGSAAADAILIPDEIGLVTLAQLTTRTDLVEDAAIVDHGFHHAPAFPLTPAATYSPTATGIPPSPTPAPSVTATPAATATPRPATATPVTTAAATGTPAGSMAIRLEMPTWVSPGQSFWITAKINNSLSPVWDGAYCFVLELAGHYWCWPSWCHYHPEDGGALDFRSGPVPLGRWHIPVLSLMTWPDTGDEMVTDLVMYGILATGDLSHLLCDMDVVSWGYGPGFDPGELLIPVIR